MIIGISGKIGSGKDTIGKIIQFLVLESTIKSGLPFNNQELPNSGWEIKKFAGKLKQVASLLTGISLENFEDQEFKKSYLGSEWGTVKPNPFLSIKVFKNIGFNRLMSVRELLQKLGTEAMRDGLHVNVWINALFSDYTRGFPSVVTGEYNENTPYPNWITTDMRFPNEMDSVIERKGITVRVTRNNGTRTLSDMSNHPSEISLDNAKFDYEINNDGTLEELIVKVEAILKIEKIL
jgi:hypothetical protein